MLRVGRVRPRDLSELGRRSVGGKELRAHPRVRTLRVLPEPEIRHLPVGGNTVRHRQSLVAHELQQRRYARGHGVLLVGMLLLLLKRNKDVRLKGEVVVPVGTMMTHRKA